LNNFPVVGAANLRCTAGMGARKAAYSKEYPDFCK
jgi:hypothetical protein